VRFQASAAWLSREAGLHRRFLGPLVKTRSFGMTPLQYYEARIKDDKVNTSLVGCGLHSVQFEVCFNSPMANEKNSGSKNIVLWVITVALVALAIFIYKK
jgi:hypothetical protein